MHRIPVAFHCHKRNYRTYHPPHTGTHTPMCHGATTTLSSSFCARVPPAYNQTTLETAFLPCRLSRPLPPSPVPRPPSPAIEQINRLDVLLQAEVVCATLSGSGSQTLVETVMLSAQVQAQVKGKGLTRRTRIVGAGRAVLGFDAVVMVRSGVRASPCFSGVLR